MRMLRLLAAIVMLVSLSACSSSNTSAPAVTGHRSVSSAAESAPTVTPRTNLSPLDPCKLATQAEASEAARGKVGPVEAMMNAGRKSCQFRSSDGMRIVGINIMNPSELSLFAPGTLKPISGITGHAYFDPGIHSIWIERGQRVVSITIEAPNPKNPYAPLPISSLTPEAKTFAKIIADHM